MYPRGIGLTRDQFNPINKLFTVSNSNLLGHMKTISAYIRIGDVIYVAPSRFMQIMKKKKIAFHRQNIMA